MRFALLFVIKISRRGCFLAVGLLSPWNDGLECNLSVID